MMNRLLYDVCLYQRKIVKDAYGGSKEIFTQKGTAKGSFKDYYSNQSAQAQTQGGHSFFKEKIIIYLGKNTDISLGEGISIGDSGIFSVVRIRYYQNHIKITGKRCVSID